MRILKSSKFVMAALGALLASLAFAAALSSPSQAATGTVRLHVVKAGVILGSSDGEGILYFGHRRYRLRVSGGGVGTLGVATVDLVGTVSNLRRPSDIIGSYSDAGAGLAVGGGESSATLQNDRGVVMQLQGPQTGLQISFSLGGMNVVMQ